MEGLNIMEVNETLKEANNTIDFWRAEHKELSEKIQIMKERIEILEEQLKCKIELNLQLSETVKRLGTENIKLKNIELNNGN